MNVFVVMIVSLLVWRLYLAQISQCGLDPNSERILVAGARSLTHPQVDPRVELRSIHIVNGVSAVTISVSRFDKQLEKWVDKEYSSADRGKSWTLLEASWSYFTNLPEAKSSDSGVMSSADPRVLYASGGGGHRSDYRVSLDAGETWTLVHPKVESGRHAGLCDIVATGSQDRGVFMRIYLSL